MDVVQTPFTKEATDGHYRIHARAHQARPGTVSAGTLDSPRRTGSTSSVARAIVGAGRHDSSVYPAGAELQHVHHASASSGSQEGECCCLLSRPHASAAGTAAVAAAAEQSGDASRG